MTVVWVVRHRRSIDHWRSGYREVKHIGTFSTLQRAEAAIEGLAAMPGFVDFPSGFAIQRFVVDEDAV